MNRIVLKKKIELVFFAFILGCSSVDTTVQEPQKESAHTLFYRQPATDWMRDALPLGNGKLGAMAFGSVSNERITLTEKTLWDGGPNEVPTYNGGNLEGGAAHIDEIRKNIFEGNYDKAVSLGNKYLLGNGAGFGAFVVLGDLFLQFENHDSAFSHYVRALDIKNAIHTVSYQMNDNSYQRELFVSYPNNVIAMRLTTSASALPSFFLDINSPPSKKNYRYMLDAKTKASMPPYKSGRTIIKKAVVTSNPNGGYSATLTLTGKLNSNGQEYQGIVYICSNKGEASVVSISDEDRLYIKGSDEVVVYVTAHTDYLPLYPTYKGNDYLAQNKKIIEKLRGLSYEKIRQDHLQDYKTLYDRVSLTIDNGVERNDFLATDKKLKRFSSIQDPSLIECLYNYGRYLLISSSREGSLPANLQGVWVDSTDPPWCSDYHTNINLQMNYWHAESTNLSECHKPLFDYVASLIEPGKKTASMYYNARGFVVQTMNNPYGFTAPGWSLVWGHFPAGAAWLTTHLYNHYRYNLDNEYLKNFCYPIMKEAALFWLDYLQPHTVNGKEYLVSAPSVSPEHGPFSFGATMDHQIALELFSNTLSAAKIVGDDVEFSKELEHAIDKMYPMEVGRWGQLKEWVNDIDDPNNHHRHVSHLYGLFPASLISVRNTPNLAEAAKKSLVARGDISTGWSMAWKINLWAMLQNGERSWNLITKLIRPVPTASKSGFSGGLYWNLLDAHPPFQIDGNFGFTAGVTNMLCQSVDDYIEILPALPQSWSSGSIKGIKAVGNFELDIQWENSSLSLAKIISHKGGLLKLWYKDKSLEIKTKAGEVVVIDKNFLIQ